MVVFSTLDAAIHAGFQWYDYDKENNLYIVLLDRPQGNKRVRLLAFARASSALDADNG